ncbi:F-box/kelch-repeat protein At1g57790-like [Bidens hawaiensis]|uniref:F-box/kelch-repeat protein At1g57790-like n=1 Tax=Bidens hawaiensis TaxID=980011 RepID=UPI0040493FD5
MRPIKGDNTDFDNTRSKSQLLNIPIHILEMIMELCIGIEYMMFRATCKRCYLAAPLIQWSSKTTLKRLQMYSLVSPWLMVFDNYRGVITFIDPVCGDVYFMKTPQELKDNYQIYCSRYGWLLIYKIEDGTQLAFFNPFTSNIRKLPEIPYLESFCFSAPPTSPDCMVVGFTTHGPWHVFIHFVSHDSTWRRFLLNFGDDDPYSYHFPTFYGQDVYALCNYKGVHVFRDMSEVGRSLELVIDEAPRSRCRSPTQYFLSVCDQHLLLVIVGKFGESVEVSKLKSTQEWEKLDGLGKHMIYISNTSCICLEAKTPEMENKIFFPRLLHDEDTNIVFYSHETCRYHTFDDKNIVENFSVDLFRTKHLGYPHTWIEPSWS